MTSRPGLTGSPVSTPTETADPHAWLEDVEGADQLAWVRERNAKAEAALARTERFAEIREGILEVLDSTAKIPVVTQRGPHLYNFWTDAEHERGLWRRTTWDSYRTAEPEWEVLLDLDALSAAEGESWVWHGATVLRPSYHRALVHLSRGGSDADVTRELDLTTRTWVEDGFTRPESKGGMGWEDSTGDVVYVFTDVGPGSMTTSGYPRTVRRWRRGTPLAEAPEIFAGQADDLTVSAGHDFTPGYERDVVVRALAFYESEVYLAGPDGTLTLLDLPRSSEPDLYREWLTVELREEWTVDGRRYPAGALLAIRFVDFLAGNRDFTVLFAPSSTTSLVGASWTRHHLVLTVLDDVRHRLEVLTPPRSGGPGGSADGAADVAADGAPDLGADRAADLAVAGHADDGATHAGSDRAADLAVADDSGDGAAHPGADGASAAGWRRRPLVLGGPDTELATVAVAAVDRDTEDALWVTTTGFLSPTALARVDLDADGAPAAVEPLKSLPAFFGPTGLTVSQHFAVSADGTRVPYFQVSRERADGEGRAGPAPTLLTGYGGFEIPRLPTYSGAVGRSWLARGGTYVVANIRGGGEYGPRWHQAALKENRHRAYEDFAAVAQDLIARGVTDAAHLGTQGGSNGGLLVGNMLTGYPELFGAIVCQVPLLDMKRYSHLLAGASWMAEYGDPDDPEQWEFIRGFSPYHNLDPARDYPPVLFTTSTKDDRVHPGHARKMAALMLATGKDVTYYENIEGGHGGAATNAQAAHMQALAYEFLWQRLGGPAG